MVSLKFLDFGGYANMPRREVRQIRSDFMLLPFQAVEVQLANVIFDIKSSDGFDQESSEKLADMLKNKVGSE